MRPEKAHRSFGSRLAQQIVRHVSYDIEYGFQLPYRTDAPAANPVIRTQGYSSMPRRMSPDDSHQLTLFVSTIQNISFGVGAAWKERGEWKTRVSSLGKHITTADAALFAIDMVLGNLASTLSKADHSSAEIVTESRIGLVATRDREQWTLPIVTNIKVQAQRVEEAGGRVVLTWLPNDEEVEGYDKANTAAQRAAKHQPKEMRSASLSYVRQAIEAKWKPWAKISKDIANAKKSVAARYLQLRSGHAITGTHLLRIGKVEDAQCWWCGGSSQTVAHLLLRCRKWRRQRDSLLRGMRAKEIVISARRDQADLENLFRDEATKEVLRFIGNTEVGRPMTKEENSDDYWDIGRLDQSSDEAGMRSEDGGE
jgi:hypothetical protein